MNNHDIELPPLPEPAWVDGEPYWYDRHMEAYARAAIEAYRKRIAVLEAARFAYASEFPPNEDGDPDVGSIHENIRKLKAKLEADRQRRGEPVAWRWKWKDLPDAGWQLSSVGECQETDVIKAEPLYLAPIAPQPALDAADLAFIADELRQAGKNRAADLVLTAMAYPTQPAEPCESSVSNKTACGSENWNCDSQPAEPVKVPSDAEIDAVFNDMPDGANGWLKSWGYRQFARALLARYSHLTATTHKTINQNQLKG